MTLEVWHCFLGATRMQCAPRIQILCATQMRLLLPTSLTRVPSRKRR